MSNVLQSTIHTTSQATTKLSKATTDLATIAKSLVDLSNNQVEVIAAIAEKEAELAELDVKLSETKRQKEVELTIALKENALAKVSEVLQAQGRVSVPADELVKLKTDYTNLVRDFDAKLNAETGKVNAMAEARTKAALTQKDLEVKALQAETQAKLNSQSDQLTALGRTVEDYKAQIAADRDARIQEAKARGNPVVSVTSGK